MGEKGAKYHSLKTFMAENQIIAGKGGAKNTQKVLKNKQYMEEKA